MENTDISFSFNWKDGFILAGIILISVVIKAVF